VCVGGLVCAGGCVVGVLVRVWVGGSVGVGFLGLKWKFFGNACSIGL
jgi:hypothetical protein